MKPQYFSEFSGEMFYQAERGKPHYYIVQMRKDLPPTLHYGGWAGEIILLKAHIQVGESRFDLPVHGIDDADTTLLILGKKKDKAQFCIITENGEIAISEGNRSAGEITVIASPCNKPSFALQCGWSELVENPISTFFSTSDQDYVEHLAAISYLMGESKNVGF
ncbi:hypothetical protein [Anaerotruncus colihominis]|uniref:hypothetical protein n=1 Tax=Anaerotruncus colihominis TaxID=169435 RepID=UPI00174C9AB5|nr:hypothetical protein [Anaerotruncus colihominis]